MHEYVDRLAASAVAVDEGLEREFETRLVESSTLAFRVAFSVLRHRQDAEDVAQDAFAKAYRAFRQLRNRERFRAWLVRTTWRLALDRQRADRRRLARESGHAATRPLHTAVEQGDADHRVAQLWLAIDRLPEKLRLVIVLASLEEHDIGEVAHLLGIPAGTVKSRLFEARRRLKEQLS
jgi:RNA polymerase sigma-70 factor (ECF subfamily)